ncbi:MAG: hypothetical protein H6983_23895 [Ectothiorhodospiraceae bacterium]|nr:hypothetical protein [Chromatiales bacterium]MCP5157241.1 hypothetical protein [Ectothiorhodospiraceae bacterium]
MNVRPMLGELEVPGIQRIGVTQRRRLVDVPIPGLEGGLTQDLGAEAACLVVEGTLAGDERRDAFLESVRGIYDSGEPADFVADIVTATEIFQVMVVDLAVDEHAGSTDPFAYRLVLRQYVPPPEPPSGPDLGFDGLDDLDAALDLEAGDLFDLMELPELLSVPDLSDPTPPLRGILGEVGDALGNLGDLGSRMDALFGDGS